MKIIVGRKNLSKTKKRAARLLGTLEYANHTQLTLFQASSGITWVGQYCPH